MKEDERNYSKKTGEALGGACVALLKHATHF